MATPRSVAEIEQQFSMKNTMGYGLNSFLDHDPPASTILAHLVVGSEGTLAFVAEVVMRTVPLLRHAAHRAARVRRPVARPRVRCPPSSPPAPATIELLDATSLRVGQTDPQADAPAARICPCDEQAALLVEYQGATAADADALAHRGHRRARGPPGHRAAHARPPTPSPGPRLWHIRKGLYAAVAGARPSGTTALLEDIVVPVPALLPTCERLTALFDRHGYADGVIFGHAKDGNIHFMLTERFDAAARSTASPGSPRTWSSWCSARRLAQGRARHRPDDGAVRAPPVRRRAVRR